MTTPTDAEHGITLDALEQLGKNRPGRTWLRDNVKLWEDQSTLYRHQAAKLQEMVNRAMNILRKHNAEKAESHDARQTENKDGGEAE